MTLILYDLALSDIDVRPSPFCWLAKFALLHKSLEFETAPLRFAEKQNYPAHDHKTLPVLRDGEKIICDSAIIIAHLDGEHAGPALLSTDGERAAADFYGAWLGLSIFPALAPKLIPLIHAHAHEDDKDYFRSAREERFGKTLEELAATPRLDEKMEMALKTLAAPLARHKFLGGEDPNLCDYKVFAPFMWQRSVLAEDFYEAPQSVDAWRERMLDLFDGYARNAKSAG
ncbi:MAG: glutathione S-transferase family protein [Marinicaulis sp.]|nr:glutathione S-transferase family protein [Marinicaulis sp.]NNL89104.1 glutathione S-transferase family protein [Marinicaulis sp.]